MVAVLVSQTDTDDMTIVQPLDCYKEYHSNKLKIPRVEATCVRGILEEKAQTLGELENLPLHMSLFDLPKIFCSFPMIKQNTHVH